MLSQLEWHTFTIPVDLPQIDVRLIYITYIIVLIVHVGSSSPLQASTLLKNPFSTEPRAGRKTLYSPDSRLPAIVSVNVSCYWSGYEGASKRQYRMRFEVDEMIRDWLISGQKRGEFCAEVC